MHLRLQIHIPCVLVLALFVQAPTTLAQPFGKKGNVGKEIDEPLLAEHEEMNQLMDSAGLKELRRWVGFTADKQLDKALGIQQNPEKTLLSRLYFGRLSGGKQHRQQEQRESSSTTRQSEEEERSEQLLSTSQVDAISTAVRECMRTLLQAGQAAGGDGSSGASQSPATAAAAGKEITPEVLDLVRTSESDHRTLHKNRWSGLFKLEAQMAELFTSLVTTMSQLNKIYATSASLRRDILFGIDRCMPEESFTTLLPHLLLLNQMGREKFVGKLRAMTTIGVPWAEIIRACKAANITSTLVNRIVSDQEKMSAPAISDIKSTVAYNERMAKSLQTMKHEVVDRPRNLIKTGQRLGGAVGGALAAVPALAYGGVTAGATLALTCGAFLVSNYDDTLSPVVEVPLALVGQRKREQQRLRVEQAQVELFTHLESQLDQLAQQYLRKEASPPEGKKTDKMKGPAAGQTSQQSRAVLTPLHASSRTAADMKKTDDEESPLTKSLGEGSAAGGSLRGPSYRPHSV